MDAYSSMTTSQLLKELQTHKKYKGKTQKQIKDKLGNIDQLRKELRRLKNKKEKIDDTIKEEKLVDDTITEILLRSDYDTLKQFCVINKEAVKLCQNEDFWNKKLSLEGLPIIFDKVRDYQDFFNDIDIHYKEAGTKNKFLILYYYMLYANKEAKKILLVNKIESERKFKPTTGLMQCIDLNYSNIKYLQNLPEQLINKLNQYKLETIYQIDIESDSIKLYISDTKSVEYEVEGTINNHEVVNMITLLLFDKYIGYSDVNIIDSEGNEFFHDEESYLYIKGDIHRALKYVIFETLSYNK